MNNNFKIRLLMRGLIIIGCVVAMSPFASCRKENNSVNVDEQQEQVVPEDAVPLPVKNHKDTTKEDEKIEVPKFDDSSEAMQYMKASPDADKYLSGVLPLVAQGSPSYAKRLLENEYSKFIVVDKGRMRVILYDKYGRELKSYKMACARNFGTKHKRADSRTPEGFFSVQGIYDSTDWLFTDDNGRTSKKKGQFGPRFIRISTPVSSQIGIHGTCAPWSVGSRASHGCIRITNEQILELVGLVEVGMPVIVIPGKRDRKVNRMEGHNVPFFATSYEGAQSVKDELEKIKKNIGMDEKSEASAAQTAVAADSAAVKDVESSPKESESVKPDSVTQNNEYFL